MSVKLNLNKKLDFEDIDLTPPDIVIGEVLNQLPDETNGLICGKIQQYNGHVVSYTKSGFPTIAMALGNQEREVDIQEDLGKIGTETHKYECFLYTPEYEKYKYRMFFVKYNISNYPVIIVLEESIAKSISIANKEYIFTCNTRRELEELIVNVLTSKRIISVMQELIRINQATKLVKNKDNVGIESEA